MTKSGYRLLEPLGRGGMSVVYRALQQPLDRVVALKLIRPDVLPDALALKRFEREIRATMELDHPGIVKVLDCGDLDGQPFYTMEYLEDARALSAVLAAGGPLQPARAADIALALTDALEFCHARGFIHRDVKPSNVMITDEGLPILMDFGLVRWLGATVMTDPGDLLGTPRYLSPEAIKGHEPGPDFDLWGLGAILYEMLAGRPAFQAASILELIALIEKADPGSPARVRGRSETALDCVAVELLARQPARRPSSAAAARAIIQRAATGPLEARGAERARGAVDGVAAALDEGRAPRPGASRTGSGGTKLPLALVLALAVALCAAFALARRDVRGVRAPDHRGRGATIPTAQDIAVEEPRETGRRLLLRIHQLAPATLCRTIITDIERVPPRPVSGPEMDRIQEEPDRDRFAGRLVERLPAALRQRCLGRIAGEVARGRLPEALARWARTRDSILGGGALPESELDGLYTALEELRDLDELSHHLGARIPGVREALASRAWGPQDAPAPGSRAVVTLDLSGPASPPRTPGADSGRWVSAAQRATAFAFPFDPAETWGYGGDMTLLVPSSYSHPEPLWPARPAAGRFELIADVKLLSRCGAFRVRAAGRRDAPASGWRLIANIHARTEQPERLVWAVPAVALPEGPLFVRIELVYWRLLRALSGRIRQDAHLYRFAVRRVDG